MWKLWLACKDCCCCSPPANFCSVLENSIRFIVTRVSGFVLTEPVLCCRCVYAFSQVVWNLSQSFLIVITHSASSEGAPLQWCHALSAPFASGCRFPGRARALADSIQGWLDMQEENAQAFKNKLDATFIQKTKLVPKPASVMSNDSRRESSQSLIALSDSGSPAKPLARTSSSKKAVLVAR